MDCLYSAGASQRRRCGAGIPLEDGIDALRARSVAVTRGDHRIVCGTRGIGLGLAPASRALSSDRGESTRRSSAFFVRCAVARRGLALLSEALGNPSSQGVAERSCPYSVAKKRRLEFGPRSVELGSDCVCWGNEITPGDSNDKLGKRVTQRAVRVTQRAVYHDSVPSRVQDGVGVRMAGNAPAPQSSGRVSRKRV